MTGGGNNVKKTHIFDRSKKDDELVVLERLPYIEVVTAGKGLDVKVFIETCIQGKPVLVRKKAKLPCGPSRLCNQYEPTLQGLRGTNNIRKVSTLDLWQSQRGSILTCTCFPPSSVPALQT